MILNKLNRCQGVRLQIALEAKMPAPESVLKCGKSGNTDSVVSQVAKVMTAALGFSALCCLRPRVFCDFFGCSFSGRLCVEFVNQVWCCPCV